MADKKHHSATDKVLTDTHPPPNNLTISSHILQSSNPTVSVQPPADTRRPSQHLQARHAKLLLPHQQPPASHNPPHPCPSIHPAKLTTPSHPAASHRSSTTPQPLQQSHTTPPQHPPPSTAHTAPSHSAAREPRHKKTLKAHRQLHLHNSIYSKQQHPQPASSSTQPHERHRTDTRASPPGVRQEARPPGTVSQPDTIKGGSTDHRQPKQQELGWIGHQPTHRIAEGSHPQTVQE